ELRVLVSGVRKRLPVEREPLRVQAQELLGHLLDLLVDLRLRLLEGLPAEAIDLRLVAVTARVLLQLVQPGDREEQLVPAPVLDDEHLHERRRDPTQLLVAAHAEALPLEPEVLPDAVLRVDDVVARRELPEV